MKIKNEAVIFCLHAAEQQFGDYKETRYFLIPFQASAICLLIWNLFHDFVDTTQLLTPHVIQITKQILTPPTVFKIFRLIKYTLGLNGAVGSGESGNCIVI